ncbi:MAG: DUF3872 domain-containing protein [Tannerella sp.]|jgi:hypothetical protein|nr:DUF3872 domain-containing protein [Tannerella sp.]
MKNRIGKIIIGCYVLGALAFVCACSDRLDIKQDYAFDLETLPVQKTIAVNETAEIRCRLIVEGDYSENEYCIRYFQSEGQGILMDDRGTVFSPNDLYPLTKKTFRLYYKSLGTGSQALDVYIVNSFGKVIQKTFSFTNSSTQTDNNGVDLAYEQFKLLTNGHRNRLLCISGSGMGNYYP